MRTFTCALPSSMAVVLTYSGPHLRPAQLSSRRGGWKNDKYSNGNLEGLPVWGGGGSSSASYCLSSCICTQTAVVTQIPQKVLYTGSLDRLSYYILLTKNPCIRWSECASAPVVSAKGANSCSPRLTHEWWRVSALPAMTMRWPAAVRTAVHLDMTAVHQERTDVHLDRTAVHLDRTAVHLDSTVVHLTVQLNRRAPSISREEDERAGGQTSTKNLHLHCKVNVFLIVYLATCL